MALKETNRLRVARIIGRFDTRVASRASDEARAAFDASFDAIRRSVLLGLLDDIGAELRGAGHDYATELDAHAHTPSVAFRVKLQGGDPRHANTILFFVRHDGPSAQSEVIAELSLRGEYELGRFRDLGEMTRATLEQMVVDGLEHMIACNQP